MVGDKLLEQVRALGTNRGLGVGDPLQTAGRQSAGDDLVDDPVTGSNADKLTLFRR